MATRRSYCWRMTSRSRSRHGRRFRTGWESRSSRPSRAGGAPHARRGQHPAVRAAPRRGKRRARRAGGFHRRLTPRRTRSHGRRARPLLHPPPGRSGGHGHGRRPPRSARAGRSPATTSASPTSRTGPVCTARLTCLVRPLGEAHEPRSSRPDSLRRVCVTSTTEVIGRGYAAASSGIDARALAAQVEVHVNRGIRLTTG